MTERNRDPNAAVGQYEGKTQEEIQAELDKIVEEGMFNISINSTVTMEKGSDEAELRIENIAANHHLMSVEITLDDTGEVLYTSGLIEPGYADDNKRVKRVKRLSQSLRGGSDPAWSGADGLLLSQLRL